MGGGPPQWVDPGKGLGEGPEEGQPRGRERVRGRVRGRGGPREGEGPGPVRPRGRVRGGQGNPPRGRLRGRGGSGGGGGSGPSEAPGEGPKWAGDPGRELGLRAAPGRVWAPCLPREEGGSVEGGCVLRGGRERRTACGPSWVRGGGAAGPGAGLGCCE